MSPEQRLAIEWECTRLVNLYANLNDVGRWEALAALYAEDGLMSRPTAPDAPTLMPNASATASRAPMVAMLPLSKYLNGAGVVSSPRLRAVPSLPT